MVADDNFTRHFYGEPDSDYCFGARQLWSGSPDWSDVTDACFCTPRPSPGRRLFSSSRRRWHGLRPPPLCEQSPPRFAAAVGPRRGHASSAGWSSTTFRSLAFAPSATRPGPRCPSRTATSHACCDGHRSSGRQSHHPTCATTPSDCWCGQEPRGMLHWTRARRLWPQRVVRTHLLARSRATCRQARSRVAPGHGQARPIRPRHPRRHRLRAGRPRRDRSAVYLAR